MSKTLKMFNVKATPAEGRIIDFIGSNASIDRDNEVLTADGWEIDSYRKNPVFLWAHNYSELPIGKAVNVEATPEGLKFSIDFAPRETYEFADTVYKLYKGGYLNAVSVGFIGKKSQRDGDGPRKIVLKELLELSAVPVPANAEALRLSIGEAVTKGIITDKEAKDVIMVELPEEPEQPADEYSTRMKALETALIDQGNRITALEARIVTLENQKSVDPHSVCVDNDTVYKDLLKAKAGTKGEKPTLDPKAIDDGKALEMIQKFKGVRK